MPQLDKPVENVSGFRIRYLENSIIIDEWAQHWVYESPRVFLGIVFMFPVCLFLGAVLLKNGVLGMRLPDPGYYSKFPVYDWLVIAPFLCVPVIFTVVGFYVAFARIHLEVAAGSILKGNTWFGIRGRMKAVPVSGKAFIAVNCQRRSGIFGGGGYSWVVSSINAEKSVSLLSSLEKEDALKLAKTIAETAKLVLQDIPNF